MLGLNTSVDNEYTLEGTAAHALAEVEASTIASTPVRGQALRSARVRWRKEYPNADEAEMMPHVLAYVKLLKERLAVYPHSRLFLEQRMPTGIPECWGTSDAVIVSPEHVEIVDFKYGQGVAVSAEDNPQVRLYGAGALDTFGDLLGDVRLVLMTIFQPRLESVSTSEMTADDLRAWREEIVLPAAVEARGDNAHFGPSVDACRWCPAKGLCRAQMEAATAEDFSHSYDLLTLEELAAQLDRLPMVKQWITGVEDTALRLAYSEDKAIPGYKVVMSGGKRYVRDPEGAMEALAPLYEAEQYCDLKVKGIGALESLLKGQFDDVVGPYISKTEGKPSLVHESDKRKSINPNGQAASEFMSYGDPE